MNSYETAGSTPARQYAADTNMTSVVSYPTRCSLWGKAAYCGNCDGRLFKNLVQRYNSKRIIDPMEGSGTTRDVVEGLQLHGKPELRFWGGDLKDGFNLLVDKLPHDADFVWIHPPYWNMIRYSDQPEDLSTIAEYPHFLEALETCLRHCHEALVPGGRLAILVGDLRRKGKYTPIVRDVLNMEHHLGTLRSVIIKTQHNCRSDAKTYGAMMDVPIQHEYCTVFQK
jgi:hypothetical protein